MDPRPSPKYPDRDPGWQECPLRETTLRLVTDPATAATLRQAASLLEETLLDAERFDPSALSTRAELRAVAADLRYLRGFLEHVVFPPDWVLVCPEARQLVRRAGVWIRRLGALAAAIEEAAQTDAAEAAAEAVERAE